MRRLDGKTALVTGAARGIGEAIAVQFAKHGAKVIVSDIDDQQGQALVDGSEFDMHYLHLDVSDEAQWIDCASLIEEQFGGLDILVNNAGITGFLESSGPHDPENLDLDSWQTVHATNLNGVALGCKYGIRLMKTPGPPASSTFPQDRGLLVFPGRLLTPPARPASGITPRPWRCTVPKKATRSGATPFIPAPL